MPELLELARAKINLSLEVLGRRPDGYHELRSIVAFADIGDRLKIVADSAYALEVSGPFAASVPLGESNIIWKAWTHLNRLILVPNVSVHLEKNLPVAAGIGGGSADAAALLRGLLRLVGGKLNAEQIKGLSVLGADVPVCFHSKACVMEGIGEKLSVLRHALPPAIVLVNPGVGCETSAVFRAMGLRASTAFMRGAPEDAWRNDMMAAAITVQPKIMEVLRALHNTGLRSVRMSGSGATCFAYAENLEMAEVEARKLALAHPEWWVQAARLS